jgi:hypothetical protein
MVRFGMRAICVVGVLGGMACGPQVVPGETDDDGATGATSGPNTGPNTGPTSGPMTGPPDDGVDDGPIDPPPGSAEVALSLYRGVDVLFVIDDSGSMGEEQAALARGIDAFLAGLSDFRIGFTTTDNGNPWCSGTTAEGGELVLSSCRSRLGDFAAAGADVSDEACLSQCAEAWTDIPITPTTTASDPNPRPRPWIEGEAVSIGTNLPRDMSVEQAFRCFAPQGIAGCGFEQPLESAYKASLRWGTEGEDAFGFMRREALLAVVFVTDEADCSYNPAHESIFLPEGNQIFWSDPEAAAPTSAVCWNAGVACSGGPGVYDECHAVDLDGDGNGVEGASADDLAVMRPMNRYIEAFQEIENAKQRISPNHEVLVSLIAGVANDGTIPYADTAADPVFQSDFGIGPGCQSATTRAVPPVRLAELAGAFQVGVTQNRFSVCNDDYSVALEAISAAIQDHVRPACMPACVADTDPTTEVLEPACALREEAPGPDGSVQHTAIPQCAGRELPSDDVDACFIPLTDGTAGAYITDDTEDDMSDVCSDEGWNLEFLLLRRPGFPMPAGATIFADCELSAAKEIDCPTLP